MTSSRRIARGLFLRLSPLRSDINKIAESPQCGVPSSNFQTREFPRNNTTRYAAIHTVPRFFLLLFFPFLFFRTDRASEEKGKIPEAISDRSCLDGFYLGSALYTHMKQRYVTLHPRVYLLDSQFCTWVDRRKFYVAVYRSAIGHIAGLLTRHLIPRSRSTWQQQE